MSGERESQAASPPLYGEDLLQSLKSESGGLSTRTLLTLVVGGLRVRLMRSIVTMISVILAIAFLAYMGLFNLVQYNLAESIERLEAISPTPASQIADAAAAIERVDMVAAMSVDQKRGAALALDLDRVSEFENELTGLDGSISQMEGAHGNMVRALGELEGQPGVTAAELEDARARTANHREEIGTKRSRRDLLEQRIALGRWLDAPQTDDPQLVASLTSELQQIHARLLRTARTPSRLTQPQMEHVSHLLTLAESNEQSRDAAATLRGAMAQEREKRDAAEMRLMMRRAGVSVETTLAGNPMDTWLIIMALLTCTVGIANAMLMSVTERFREIGTMKCLGAQDSLVVKLFLLESAFQGTVGAGLGIVVGLLVALVSAVLQFAGYGMANFPVQQTWQVIGWSLLAGLMLAVLGAVPSALMAARMNPVDALRVEE